MSIGKAVVKTIAVKIHIGLLVVKTNSGHGNGGVVAVSTIDTEAEV